MKQNKGSKRKKKHEAAQWIEKCDKQKAPLTNNKALKDTRTKVKPMSNAQTLYIFSQKSIWHSREVREKVWFLGKQYKYEWMRVWKKGTWKGPSRRNGGGVANGGEDVEWGKDDANEDNSVDREEQRSRMSHFLTRHRTKNKSQRERERVLSDWHFPISLSYCVVLWWKFNP